MDGESYNITNYYGNTGTMMLSQNTYNPANQGQNSFEERSCWRKLYDYQSGYWYYQNLLTNITQWEKPEEWDSWPVNADMIVEKESNGEDTKLSMFRRTSEELERNNAEYITRKARCQINPDEAKKIHWIPEGANEYNIWYDKWIGDHWKGTKTEGILIKVHISLTNAS